MRALFLCAGLLLWGCEGPRERPKPLAVALPSARPAPPVVLFVDLFQRCPVPTGTSTNIDAAETVLAKKPTDPKALRAVGLAYYAAGGYEAATKALTAAQQQDPADTRTRLYLGYCQLAQGSYSAAQATLGAIPPPDPNRAAAQRELGNLCFQALQQDKQAEAHYQAALRAAPDGGEELLAFALLRASQSKTKEAVALLLKAAPKLPAGPRRAVAYAALGKLEIEPTQARTWNQKALQEDPQNPWAKKAFGK